MKKKYLIITSFVVVLLMVVVTAQVLSLRNSDVDVDKSSRDKLIEYDIVSPQTTPLICTPEECEYRMYQILPDGSTYNLATHRLPRGTCTEHNATGFNCITFVDYTRADLESRQEVQIASWLENYGKQLIEEDLQPEEVIMSNSTTITISERRK